MISKRFFYLSVICLIFAVYISAYAEGYTNYSVACPFKTLQDSIPNENLLNAYRAGESFNGMNILFPSGGKTYFQLAFGEVSDNVFYDGDPEDVINNRNCAVVRTVDLKPEWKRLSSGESPAPWDNGYDPKQDILAFPGETTDFKKDKATTVLLTGTTALARTTSYKMMVNGALYPGELIKEVFDNSDIKHISNESSIWSLCPEPTHTEGTMQFCSNTRSYELFDYLGVNVIELSGNHLRDYDWKPLLEMLDTFDEKGYSYYAAGRTYDEAAKPLFVSHNGNNFVFLGCNIAGPEHVYVDDIRPGVNRCDFDVLAAQTKEYRDKGLLPIVTIQYYETYSRVPTKSQVADFRKMADAGAAIVSGSQAHFSQIGEFYNGTPIHYGLGNLFFDQMDIPVVGTSQELLDRYVFYEGRLLQVELITARLTDYARPRLMIPVERNAFLSELFSYQVGDGK